MSKLGVNAILVHKELGRTYDRENVKEMPYGKVLEVESIFIDHSITLFNVSGYKCEFNGVNFEFVDDNGLSVDIFKDSRFNPYLQYKMA